MPRIFRMTRSLLAAAPLVLATSLSGCADEPGAGWGALTGTFTAELEQPADRFAQDGRWRTADGYGLQISTATLHGVRIEFLTDADAIEEEDAGDGHAHAPGAWAISSEADEDDHAELAPEAGDGILLALDFEEPVSLLAAEALAFNPEHCTNACRVDAQASVTAVRIEIERFEAAGAVRDLTDAARIAGTVPWTLELDEPTVITVPIPLDFGPESPALQTVLLSLHVPETLWDDVDWAAPDAEDLHEELGASELTAEVR